MEVLSKLESHRKVVESQTTHIVALEVRIEDLSTLSKASHQAYKANRAATKKVEIMVDWVTAMDTRLGRGLVLTMRLQLGNGRIKRFRGSKQGSTG